MKKFFSEFKKFITRGNIIDLAVAVVVGGAFGKIVTSLVNDIIMPLISLITGGVSVSDWKWVITPAQIVDGVVIKAESALHYGAFIQTILDFLIISFFVFLAIKILMSAQKGFTKFSKNFVEFSKKEMKKMKKQGLTDEEIATLQEEKKLQASINENQENQQKAELKEIETQCSNEKELSTELLTEIRDLLKAQNSPSIKKSTSKKQAK